MRAPMKATVILAVMVLATFSLVAAQSRPNIWVEMSEVEGLIEVTPGEYRIPIDAPAVLRIPIHVQNVNDARTAISNGYIFEGDVTWWALNATWTTAYPVNEDIACDDFGCCENPPFPQLPCYSWFDFSTDIVYINPDLSTGDNYTGVGVGIAGLTGKGSGLPADFNDVLYTIEVWTPAGAPTQAMTMDTTYWLPSNFWTWSGVGEEVDWGGPYVFQFEGDDPCVATGPYTDTWPFPAVLSNLINDRVQEFYIYCVDPDAVDMASFRVGNIPNYENEGVAVWDEANGRIETTAFIMRFLGSSGLRPISTNITFTYTISYNYLGGAAADPIYGTFKLDLVEADVNFDGVASIDDILFMTDYLFRNGPMAQIQGETLEECMDVDGSGRFDLLDVRAAIELIL